MKLAEAKKDITKRMSPEKRKAYLKRKKQVERNRKILATFVMFIIVLLMILFLIFKVFFKINTIQISGKNPYDETQIINAAGVAKGDGLLSCDEEKISENIRRNLPYIYSATIKKKLPSTLVIETKSTSAFIAVQTVSGTALADKEGKVLEFASEDKVKGKIIKLEAGMAFPAKIGEKIFETEGDNGQSRELKEKEKTLKSVLDAINSSGIKDITLVNIKSTSNIFMMYQNRFKLNIGSVSDIDYKLKAAVQIIASENKAAPSERGEIFLSNPDNIYVSPETN